MTAGPRGATHSRNGPCGVTWGPRRLFHTYDKADAFRTRLEHGERQAHALPTDTVFVAIYWRPCREWSEIA